MKKFIVLLAIAAFCCFVPAVEVHAAEQYLDGDVPMYIPEDFSFPVPLDDIQEPTLYDKLVSWYDSVISGIFKPSTSTLQSGTIAFNSIGGFGQLNNVYLQDAIQFRLFSLTTQSTYFCNTGYLVNDRLTLEFTSFNYEAYALRNYGTNVSICMLGYVNEQGHVVFGTFWRDGLFYPLSSSMTLTGSVVSSDSDLNFTAEQKNKETFDRYNQSAANFGNNSVVTVDKITMCNIPIFESYDDMAAFMSNPFVYPSGLVNKAYADFNGLVFNPYTPIIGSGGSEEDLDTSGIISFLKSGFGLFGQDGFIPMMVSAFRFIPEKVSTAIGMGTLVILLVIAFKIAL